MSDIHDDAGHASAASADVPHDPADGTLGFATQIAQPGAAPVQAVLSPDQFRKIENMQRTVGKLSRRLTFMSLLNLLVLAALGWNWYAEHRKLVDGYIARIMNTSAAAPAAKPALPPPPAQAPAAPLPEAATAPAVRDPDQAAAAQKLFDDAKALETQGHYAEAMEKLDQVKSFSSINWPNGLKEMIDRLDEQKRDHPPGDFFGVH